MKPSIIIVMIILSFFCTVGAIGMMIGQVSDANGRADNFKIAYGNTNYELQQTSLNLTNAVNLTATQQATIVELTSNRDSLQNQLVIIQSESDSYRNSFNGMSDLYTGMFKLFNNSIANESSLYNISTFNQTNTTVVGFLTGEIAKNRTYNVTDQNLYYLKDVRDNATKQHIKSATVVLQLNVTIENSSMTLSHSLLGFNVTTVGTTNSTLICYEPSTLASVTVSINSTYDGKHIEDIIWLW